MKKLSIILACVLVALAACTKSKEVHPEIGDGNDEIMTVGMKDVHVKYTRTDHADLQRVMFHYSLSETQQFAVAEMTKRETFFELTLNDLYSDTLYYYYYELFPIGGNAYQSEHKTFHTQAVDTPEPPEPPTPPSVAPEGAINGLFTINAEGDQVYFSQGNLQYQASTNTWRFAENQWDYIGESNSNISQTYNGWIDLFGWGTSGWGCGNVYYHPWDSNFGDYDLYGPIGDYNLTDNYANSDWGYYNAIANGGNQTNLWRTLTKDEWKYIFETRATTSTARYVKAQVNSINGIILFPDDWTMHSYNLNCVNDSITPFNSNVLSLTEWNALENEGAVFLSASGFREGLHVVNVELACYYWSVTSNGANDALNICVWDGLADFADLSTRDYGLSVRLVQDAR